MHEKHLISSISSACRREAGIAAAVFARSGLPYGDPIPDLDWYVVLSDGNGNFDAASWLNSVGQVVFLRSVAPEIIIAIFAGLVRVQFRFLPLDRMGQIREWDAARSSGYGPVKIVADHSAQLEDILSRRQIPGTAPDSVQSLWNGFLDSVFMGIRHLTRGERAAAHGALSSVHHHLLQLVRLREESVVWWSQPTRFLEADVTRSSQERFVRCTASLRGDDLERAYAECWAWGYETADTLSAWYPLNLVPSITDHLDAWCRSISNTTTADFNQ